MTPDAVAAWTSDASGGPGSCGAFDASAPPLPAGQPRTVAVLRGLMLGDMLCATPALRALRQGMPGAHIVLVGLPWARALAERLDSVDAFVALPGWPGLPETPAADDAARAAFVQAMRARGIDLAVQLHGSGGVTNDLIAQWQPRRQAGFGQPAVADDGGGADGRADPHCFMPWPAAGTEIERLLLLTDHMGLPRRGLQLDFPLRPGDRREARALLGHVAAADADPARTADRGAMPPYAIVHPGSQWPSRRWPPERFAAVADTLAAQGLDIVITGTAGELDLANAVARAMRHPARVLAGRTSLWSLGALVADARLVLCNDTGISHVAAALGTPSTVVASGSDVARWAPLDTARHRVLWQQLPCRPCAHVVCPHGQACALAVETAAVERAAVETAAAAAQAPADGSASVRAAKSAAL